VLIVGLGGLGCPAAMALADEGIGTLGLVDPDRVDASNLPRQLLYTDTDVGRLKVEAAAARLAARAPGLRVEPLRERFETPDPAWLGTWDAVVDGTDTIASKFRVNDACVLAGVPLAHAGAVGWRAQVLCVLPGDTPCYRCLFEEPPPEGELPSCEAAGVLGPVTALAGALQAEQVLQLLAGTRPSLAGRILTFDLGNGTWRSVSLSRNLRCAVCGAVSGTRAARRSAVP
jgi:molybdopterin-synthase adenylyltransferase